MTLLADVFPKLRTSKNMIRSIPQKSCLGGCVEKQHGKCPQTFFKYEGQLLYHFFCSLRRQLSYKKFLLVTCKISRLFPNKLTADFKYSLLDRDNLTQRIQILLSQKQKIFSEFFASFFKSSLNLEQFKKKLTLIADVFPKLGTPKTWLDQCLKSPISEDPLKSNMVNALKHC